MAKVYFCDIIQFVQNPRCLEVRIMADIFIEHMVVKKKNAADNAVRALYVLAFVLVNLMLFMVSVLFILLPAGLIGGGWLLMVLIRNQRVEFEYIVTNGIIDVDKISGRSKRKRLESLDCRNFEILAQMSEWHFKPYENFKFVKTLDASSGEDNPNRYFAVCPAKQGGKMLFIFEPNEKMIDAFKIYISRVIRQ